MNKLVVIETPPPTADEATRKAVKALHEFYVALLEEGFTKHEALIIITGSLKP